MKYGKQLLTELHDLSPVPVYIRAHHLLTSGNGIPELKWSSSNVFSLDSNGRPVYDFTITDQTFDEYKKAGVRPMVELGFMPKDLAATVREWTPTRFTIRAARSPGHRIILKRLCDVGWWCGSGTSRGALWQGAGTRWYFEVWNEPDIAYWHATPEEYDKLYDYSVAGIQAALPDAIVGGPASTGPASDKAEAFHWIVPTSIASMTRVQRMERAIPLDFISFHPKGRPTVVDGHVRMGLANELKAAGNGFRIVAKYPKYIHLPIILSEADPEGCAACSMKVNPSNAYRNGPLYPTYTATAMRLFELQDRYKVNLISMLSWSFEFEDKEYFEGFRTLATNGVDKPVLNVFRMAGLMSGERVNTSLLGQVSLDDILNTGVRQTPDIDHLCHERP